MVKLLNTQTPVTSPGFGRLALAMILVGSASCTSEAQDYVQTFESAWQTVNDRYFDPDFGGVDWRSLHDEYLPLISKAEDDEAFYRIINEMMFKLGASHLGVVPPDELDDIAPILAADGDVGFAVKYLREAAVVTSLFPDSPGAAAGLTPGSVIKAIDSLTVEKIVVDRKADLTPPFNERHTTSMITQDLQEKLFGDAGSTVSLTWVDRSGSIKEATFERVQRSGRIELGETLPSIYVEFESRRLDRGIRYIRFNAFVPPVDDRVREALEGLDDDDGLIIDLRGNPGGVFSVRKAVAEQFVSERTLFWKYRGRESVRDVYLDPADRVFSGPLVILVDVGSWSSSEEFAGGMQAIGRAVIIGEQTSGKDLVQSEEQLPNGSVLIYPVEQTRTVDGVVLEGRGVIPDIEVALDSALLEQGVDSQLRAALVYLRKRISR